jgi:hypothetical protein
VWLYRNSFVAHTSLNVFLEKKWKYAGIYSSIFAIRCFEYSTARMEYFIRRDIRCSAHYSKAEKPLWKQDAKAA